MRAGVIIGMNMQWTTRKRVDYFIESSITSGTAAEIAAIIDIGLAIQQYPI
jgi:hypothetical protein